MFGRTSSFLVLLALVGLLAGCQSMPVIPALSDQGSCLAAEPAGDARRFVALGSGSSLERATSSAQAALAQQISSTVSSEVKSATRLRGDDVEEAGSVTIKLVSENIPLDQHRIEQTCKSGSSHYVKLSLDRKALVKSSQIRLQRQLDDIEQTLRQADRKSSYERYLIRHQLAQKLVKLTLFDVLLQQYGEGHSSRPTQATAERARRFIDSNSDLRIAITAPKNLRPLLPPLESALRRAGLDYGLKKRNAAAEIRIKGRPEYQSANGRHITHLSAVIEVRRVDTGELLASMRLGKKSGTSSVSRDKSLEIALKKHIQSLKRKLHGNSAKIRKVLGVG